MRGGRQRRPVVTMVTPWLPQYRVAFYEGLRAELDRRGIGFELRHGVAPTKFAGRGDDAALPWARPFVQRRLRVGPTELELTPYLARRHADLVVLDHLAKQPVTYVQLLAGLTRLGPRTALFGHGAVDRTFILAVGRWAKKVIARLACWWFVYTEQGAGALRRYGVRPDRITVINNTLDASELASALPLPGVEVSELRERWGLGAGPVALHIGGLDASKRPELLVEVGERVHQQLPGFRLVVAGGGSAAPAIEEAAGRLPWLRYVGPRFGQERIELFAMADVLLHPGKVGLVAIDSFAAGTPIVTAAGQLQAPEFDYLDEATSVICPAPDAARLTEATVALLQDEPALASRAAACRAELASYPIEEMVVRMADGIERALGRPLPAGGGVAPSAAAASGP